MVFLEARLRSGVWARDGFVWQELAPVWAQGPDESGRSVDMSDHAVKRYRRAEGESDFTTGPDGHFRLKSSEVQQLQPYLSRQFGRRCGRTVF